MMSYDQVMMTVPGAKIGIMPGGCRVFTGTPPKSLCVTEVVVPLIDYLLDSGPLPAAVETLEIQTIKFGSRDQVLESTEIIRQWQGVVEIFQDQRKAAGIMAGYLTDILGTKGGPKDWKAKFELLARYWQLIQYPLFSPGSRYPLMAPRYSASFEVTSIGTPKPVYEGHLWGVKIELVLPVYLGQQEHYPQLTSKKPIQRETEMNEYDLLHSLGCKVQDSFEPRVNT